MHTHTHAHATAAGTDTAAIHALLRSSAESWGRGDGAGYGAHFTEDATDVTFVGTVYRGATEIGSAHQALFDGFLKGTKLVVDIVDLRFPAPGTAIAVTRGEVHKGARRPRRLGKLATYTLVRTTGGDWRIAAVQKTKHRPLMEAFSFRAQPKTRPQAQELFGRP
ncbi:SgcJ/EcaC family oxidoreductase [Streptomyces sp. NPDC005828]|uniref:SgcJ/EcaC family oxidoreductase n=1 Tax=Streptomyces sp. NPDC005828 TaxID=3157071 RepID=UPI0034053F78